MTKSVRLEDRVYEKVEARKREDETFSEAIDRLLGGPSLVELAGVLSGEEADEMREAIERSREAERADRDELVDRFDHRE